MKEINIKDIKIQINMHEILNLISSKKSFIIDIDGSIFFDKEEYRHRVIIFSFDGNMQISKIATIDEMIKNIFKDYKIELKENSYFLSVVYSWNKIIFLNQAKMLYFDHQTDGIELFEDDELENMGWNSIACDITYREISDYIEANCNGTLVYYDNEIQFNGFVLVDDIDDVKLKVRKFLKEAIKKRVEDNLIDTDDEDVIESLEFFDIRV